MNETTPSTTPNDLLEQEGQAARVTIGDCHYFLGYIRDGLFYAEDEVSNGLSYRALTHSGPGYKPIPLAYLKESGYDIEFLEKQWPSVKCSE